MNRGLLAFAVPALLGPLARPTTAPATRMESAPPHQVTRAPFGRAPDGTAVDLYTLRNAHGIETRVTNYGGLITSIRTPDRSGHLDDIVLGFDNIGGYEKDSPYFGALVGRVGNRIARGQFTLDGQTYHLAINNGPNSLHGGLKGFDKVVWKAESFRNDTSVGVVLQYTSPNGEEGYPGTLQARVTYTLTDRNQLVVDYHATTDKATPVNLTQHSYFNLAGDGKRDILGHVVTLNADSITPVDTTLIPTGEFMAVTGTPFDFRSPTAIGTQVDRKDNQQIRFGGGIDHNFVLNRRGAAGLVHAAHVMEPTTGRTLDISTTEPGLQFYTGNFLDGTITGKDGHIYHYRYGFAMETQHFPDSPNHPSFPSIILRPGQEYSTRTVFAFGVAK